MTARSPSTRELTDLEFLLDRLKQARDLLERARSMMQYDTASRLRDDIQRWLDNGSPDVRVNNVRARVSRVHRIGCLCVECDTGEP